LFVTLDDIAELKARHGGAPNRDGCFGEARADDLGGQLRDGAGRWVVESVGSGFLRLPNSNHMAPPSPAAMASKTHQLRDGVTGGAGGGAAARAGTGFAGAAADVDGGGAACALGVCCAGGGEAAGGSGAGVAGAGVGDAARRAGASI
jgi:hypothetical protein